MSPQLFPILIAAAASLAAAALSRAADTNFVPARFRASIGGFLGPSYFLQLTNGVVHYEAKKGTNVVRLQITPTSDQWREFRQTLDRLKIWSWRANYANADVVDGTQWQLWIEYPDRVLRARGSNNYPAASGEPNDKTEPTKTFESYLAAVQALLGGKDFR